MTAQIVAEPRPKNLQPATSKPQPPTRPTDYRAKSPPWPKEQRDAIKKLLLDGATYPAVITLMLSRSSVNISCLLPVPYER